MAGVLSELKAENKTILELLKKVQADYDANPEGYFTQTDSVAKATESVAKAVEQQTKAIADNSAATEGLAAMMEKYVGSSDGLEKLASRLDPNNMGTPKASVFEGLDSDIVRKGLDSLKPPPPPAAEINNEITLSKSDMEIISGQNSGMEDWLKNLYSKEENAENFENLSDIVQKGDETLLTPLVSMEKWLKGLYDKANETVWEDKASRSGSGSGGHGNGEDGIGRNGSGYGYGDDDGDDGDDGDGDFNYYDFSRDKKKTKGKSKGKGKGKAGKGGKGAAKGASKGAAKGAAKGAGKKGLAKVATRAVASNATKAAVVGGVATGVVEMGFTVYDYKQETNQAEAIKAEEDDEATVKYKNELAQAKTEEERTRISNRYLAERKDAEEKSRRAKESAEGAFLANTGRAAAITAGTVVGGKVGAAGGAAVGTAAFGVGAAPGALVGLIGGGIIGGIGAGLLYDQTGAEEAARAKWEGDYDKEQTEKAEEWGSKQLSAIAEKKKGLQAQQADWASKGSSNALWKLQIEELERKEAELSKSMKDKTMLEDFGTNVKRNDFEGSNMSNIMAEAEKQGLTKDLYRQYGGQEQFEKLFGLSSGASINAEAKSDTTADIMKEWNTFMDNQQLEQSQQRDTTADIMNEWSNFVSSQQLDSAAISNGYDAMALPGAGGSGGGGVDMSEVISLLRSIDEGVRGNKVVSNSNSSYSLTGD
jgi:hypothetical protein